VSLLNSPHLPNTFFLHSQQRNRVKNTPAYSVAWDQLQSASPSDAWHLKETLSRWMKGRKVSTGRIRGDCGLPPWESAFFNCWFLKQLSNSVTWERGFNYFFIFHSTLSRLIMHLSTC